MATTVYLIPTVLAEGVTEPLPPYITDAIKACTVFFVEDERTARRFVKLLWKEMVIDEKEWLNMKQITPALADAFRKKIREGKNIGIISEAGCPGVADPGQELVKIAQELKILVKPLVGPSSILLALMGSGMNGQHFEFVGYLPIEAAEKLKAIRQLESSSRQYNSTKIFIETPYRNNQMLETLVKTCMPHTRICVAVDLTAPTESIQTRTAAEWKKDMPQLHKRPAMFLLYAGE
jgi:16S rRNA (cytidine1402-2'-O)-methyltransferase